MLRYLTFIIITLCVIPYDVLAVAIATQDDIQDPFLQRLTVLVGNHQPSDDDVGPYGMLPNGQFRHPQRTYHTKSPKPFQGQLSYWDTQSYQRNMQVEAYYPITVEPFHTWQNIIDFDGRRYLYQYVRQDLKIFDITNPKSLKLIHTKGHTWGPDGPNDKPENPYPQGDMFGAATIQWHQERQKYIMVQAYEIRRFGLLKNKYKEPEKVAQIRRTDHLKGFKVFEMHGPLPHQWTLIAERTTDIYRPKAPIGQQEGSGVRDIPVWFGGKYMFVAAAPSDEYALTEYGNDLYSAGYQAWDMSDPTNPVFLDQLTVPGQKVGNFWDELNYFFNPRAGNRTSWMGARMSLFIPKPVEEGGKYGYAAMGGLGLYIIDIQNPRQMKVIGHLDFPPSVAGTEGDFIDVSQVLETGIIYYSGYPLNEDCFEPYKHIYEIDVQDPSQPSIKGVLSRPLPPREAIFTDFCQRKGSFGPKRTGAYTQPGVSRFGVLPYNFYNAGLQVFDVSNPTQPVISAYFVPPFRPDKVVDYAMGNLSHAVYVEYDRNLFWLFTNHGIYLLSSPVLGTPSFSAPISPWPKR
ncbi:LVIVD repeat-containing protein [Algicola sagamiensis]|uniref:LVIVD repeat-containing protein n=1 Tax=Algicola sagamiensis TaxID=163869 RepID=UPI000369AD6E|nr:hypothetical protein [Algicola sagamiensis]